MIPGKTHIRWLIRWVLRLLGVSGGVFLLIVLHVVSQFPGDPLPEHTSARPVSREEIRRGLGSNPCGIVFGAAVRGGSEAGPGILRRVQAAADLYHQGSIQTIILTGGKGSQIQESEAAVMQKVAMRLGIDSEDLILEDQATSTWENLAFTKELIGDCSSIVAISDRYHLARIEYLAELQGWGNLRTLPAGRVPLVSFEVRAVVREALGHIYYTLRQYFDIEKYILSVSDFQVI